MSDDEIREAQLCFAMHKTGTCARGDQCPWLHAETAEDKARVEAAKKRRSGKAKGKGKSKTSAGAALSWEPAWSAES